MNRSVLMQSMHAKQSVKQKCFAVLKDLEATYIDLSTGHKWNGVGHNNSAFVTQVAYDDSYEAYALAAIGERLPYDEWVKEKVCHACGKKGHIAPRCPDKKSGSNGYGRNNGGRGRGGGRGGGRGSGDHNDHRSQRNKEERRFKKAYKIALETMEDEDTSSGDENDASASPRANVAGITNEENDSMDSLAAHAARMYSSLKD